MSSDVVVTMDITLRPEVASHFERMDPAALDETRKFPGCRGVQIVLHKEDTGRFLFIERWQSEQDYRNYIAWRSESGHFQQLQAMSTAMKVDVWPQTVITV